jgi:hypothetical protein
MDASMLAECLKLSGKGTRDGERKARSTLDQLARHGLLTVEIKATETGRCKLYRPKGGVSSPPSQPSQPSHPPSLQGVESKTLIKTVDGRDERDKRDVRTHTPLVVGSSWDVGED